MSVQELAIQMIYHLSDENVKYLIDFMKRFMLSKDEYKVVVSKEKNTVDTNFMQEMETMRIKSKSYFPDDLDSDKIWEEAIDEKYGSVD